MTGVSQECSRFDPEISVCQWQPGRGREADAALARLTAMSSTEDPFRIAEVHAYRGDADESFKWLALATRPSDPEGQLLPAARNLWDIRASPLLSSLHTDPRWTAWVSGQL